MRYQQVTVDVGKMLVTATAYLALAFAAWVLLRLVSACISLPAYLRKQQEEEEEEERRQLLEMEAEGEEEDGDDATDEDADADGAKAAVEVEVVAEAAVEESVPDPAAADPAADADALVATPRATNRGRRRAMQQRTFATVASGSCGTAAQQGQPAPVAEQQKKKDKQGCGEEKKKRK